MNLDWDDATKTYNLTKKAIDDRENFKLKQELRQASEQPVEKTQAYTPDQVAKLTDDAEKAGGVWSESDQAYKMPDGGLRLPTNTPTWENGAYKTADGQSVSPAAQYKFGAETRNTEFTPEEIKGLRMQSRADIYRKYGRDTEADQLESAGLQRKAAQLQINKSELDAKRETEWEKYTETAGKLSSQFAEVDKQVEKMLKAGDTIGAARLIAQFRTDTIPDGRAIIINQDGVLTGIDNDGTTKQSDKNAYNPNVVAAMRADLKGSVSDYLRTMRPSMGFDKDRMISRDEAQDAQWNRTYEAGRSDRAEDNTYRNSQLRAQIEQWGAQNGIERDKLDQAWAINERNRQSAERIAAANNATSRANAKTTRGAYEILEPFGTGPDGKPVFKSNHNGLITIGDDGTRSNLKSMEGVKRFALEAKDNTKAEEAFAKYITENPQASPTEIEIVKRNLGLAAAPNYNEDPTLPAGKGLQVKPGSAFSPSSGSVFAGKRVIDNNIVPDSRLQYDPMNGSYGLKPRKPEFTALP